MYSDLSSEGWDFRAKKKGYPVKRELSAIGLEKASRKRGVYRCGNGLYLIVGSSRPGHAGTRSWVFRYMRRGKARAMGLGRYPDRSFARAKDQARKFREMLAEGKDPLEERRALRDREVLEAAKAITFQEAAEQFITARKAGWQNTKHAAQWSATLATYAYPIIGALSVAAVDTSLVMKVLEPMWTAKPETANRLRGRIEAVLDWAKVRGYRAGENPARWRGHLDKLLPARSKVRKIEHHAALPYAGIPAFMATLAKQDGVAARALEFAILTAARTGEVLGARWGEINLAEKLWTIPAVRMKGGREHRVPLSTAAIEILQGVLKIAGNGEPDAYVFPGANKGKPLSNMALTMTLRRMDRDDLTVHGFRSTFRDWAAERTSYPSEVAEMALAHAVGDKTEAAYRRGDMFERRRALAVDWASYCKGRRSRSSAKDPKVLSQ